MRACSSIFNLNNLNVIKNERKAAAGIFRCHTKIKLLKQGKVTFNFFKKVFLTKRQFFYV